MQAAATLTCNETCLPRLVCMGYSPYAIFGRRTPTNFHYRCIEHGCELDNSTIIRCGACGEWRFRTDPCTACGSGRGINKSGRLAAEEEEFDAIGPHDPN